MTFTEYFAALRGKEVGVIGYGVSNRPLLPILLANGAHVTVYDQKSPAELGESALALADEGVRFVSGEGYLGKAEGDLLLRSPGIHPGRLEGCRGKLTSETEIFFEVAPCPIIGITGSDGKSTTTTLTSLLLSAGGYKAHLGGNIGRPLLPEVPSMKPEDIAVIELSSFQLMTFTSSPHVAVVTNMAANHMDIHKGMEEYIEAKRQIFLHQKPGDLLVINRDNPITSGFTSLPGVTLRSFSSSGKHCAPGDYYLEKGCICRDGEPILAQEDILLPGKHNVENYMAAIAATAEYIDKKAIRPVATGFGGVKHRLQLVRTLNGIRFYNSSIDSSPTRTNAALSVFRDKGEKVVCILGGYDKHLDYAPLHDPAQAACAGVVLMGNTGPKIDAALSPALPRAWAQNMPEAVKKAYEMAQSLGSKVVLLSPASASFDLFRNFEERGEVFCTEVQKL